MLKHITQSVLLNINDKIKKKFYIFSWFKYKYDNQRCWTVSECRNSKPGQIDHQKIYTEADRKVSFSIRDENLSVCPMVSPAAFLSVPWLPAIFERIARIILFSFTKSLFSPSSAGLPFLCTAAELRANGHQPFLPSKEKTIPFFSRSRHEI